MIRPNLHWSEAFVIPATVWQHSNDLFVENTRQHVARKNRYCSLRSSNEKPLYKRKTFVKDMYFIVSYMVNYSYL